jgi:hypothetical protein
MKIGMGRPRSGRLPFLVFRVWGETRCSRRGRRVEKWETWFWFSTFPSGARRGCGNVGISRGGRDFQGAVGSVGNVGFVFHAFHGPVISTAFWAGRHRKRGGTGDSILHRRSSCLRAVFIFRALSVSLIAVACWSSRFQLRLGFRYCAALGSERNFS